MNSKFSITIYITGDEFTAKDTNVVLYSPLKDGKSFQNARRDSGKFWNKYEELSEHELTTAVRSGRYWLGRRVDKRTLVHLFMRFNLKLNKSDYSKPNLCFCEA